MSELHAKNLVRTVARAFYDDVSDGLRGAGLVGKWPVADPYF